MPSHGRKCWPSSRSATVFFFALHDAMGERGREKLCRGQGHGTATLKFELTCGADPADLRCPDRANPIHTRSAPPRLLRMRADAAVAPGGGEPRRACGPVRASRSPGAVTVKGEDSSSKQLPLPFPRLITHRPSETRETKMSLYLRVARTWTCVGGCLLMSLACSHQMRMRLARALSRCLSRARTVSFSLSLARSLTPATVVRAAGGVPANLRQDNERAG